MVDGLADRQNGAIFSHRTDYLYFEVTNRDVAAIRVAIAMKSGEWQS